MSDEIEILFEGKSAQTNSKRLIENVSLSEIKKDKGNEYIRNNQYDLAIECYTEAIELNPNNHVFFGNRALAFIFKNKWQEALEDANSAIKIDPSYAKGWLQLLRCNLSFGNIQPANLAEKRLRELHPDKNYPEYAKLDELIRANENLHKSLASDDYRGVIFYSTSAMKIATCSLFYPINKAEALAHMHRYEDANDILVPLQRLHPTNAKIHYARGVVLYYQEMFDRAIAQFQTALRLEQDEPKFSRALKVTRLLVETKEAGNQAYRAKRYEEALDKYEQCLKIDPNHKSCQSKLFYNIAVVSSALNETQKAVDSCHKAIELDPNYYKAQIKLSQLYLEMEKFEDAVRELDKLYQKNRTREIRTMLEEAKLALKRSKRKDWYKILGVSKDASEDEIKRAYKKAAVVHHPDKHQNDPEDVQLKHEMMMKDLNSAQATLLDKEKRRRYDLGMDDSESYEDPHVVFNNFFHNNSFFDHVVFRN